jgi:hypothetical protein
MIVSLVALFVGCDSLPPEKATVHISLTTEGGGNFHGAEVKLLNIANGKHNQSAIARSNIVRFTNVVYGVYDFEISHPNYITSRLVSINVSQERVDEALDLQRLRANIVDISLRTSDGMPISDARVMLSHNDPLFTGKSEGNGQYLVHASGSTGIATARFTDVVYGDYTLTIDMGDRYFGVLYSPLMVQAPFVLPGEDEFFVLHSKFQEESARVRIPIRTSDITPIIGATVRLSNITLTNIVYEQEISSVHGSTQAEALFNSVELGRYSLTVTLQGYTQHRSDLHVSDRDVNVPIITLFPGESNLAEEIIIPFRTGDNQPIIGAEVILRNNNDDLNITYSRTVNGESPNMNTAEARFTNEVVPGSYTLTIQLAGYQIYTRNNVLINDGVNRLQESILLPNDNEVIIPFRICYNQRITAAEVRLANNNGNPAMVYTRTVDGLAHNHSTAEVRFTNEVVPGSYTLTILLEGYHVHTMNDVQIRAGSNPLDEMTLIPITTLTNVVIVPFNTNDNRPIVGAIVTLANNNNNQNMVFTRTVNGESPHNNSAEARFMNEVIPGSYTLTIQLTGYQLYTRNNVSIPTGSNPIQLPQSVLMQIEELKNEVVIGFRTGNTPPQPIVGAVVTLTNNNNNPSMVYTRTVNGFGQNNSEAEARFVDEVIPGNYTLTISLEGYHIFTRSNVPVHAVNNPPISNLVLTPLVPFTNEVVIGFKTANNAMPIVGAIVTLANNNNSQNMIYTRTVNGSGENNSEAEAIFVNEVIPGSYTLTIELDGFYIFTKSNVPVETGDGNGETGLVLKVIEPFSNLVVIGFNTKYNQPIVGAIVTLTNNNNNSAMVYTRTVNGFGDNNSEAEARFVDEVVPGSYTLTITLAGYQIFTKPDIEVFTGTDANNKHPENELIPIPPFTNNVIIDFRTGDIPQPLPILDALVTLTNNNGDPGLVFSRTVSSVSGIGQARFIDEVVPGNYTLSIRLTGYQLYTFSNVDVTEGDVTMPMTLPIVLQPLLNQVKVQFSTVDQQAIVAAQVILTNNNGNQSMVYERIVNGLYNDISTAEANFTNEIEPGWYTLTIILDKYQVFTRNGIHVQVNNTVPHLINGIELQLERANSVKVHFITEDVITIANATLILRNNNDLLDLEYERIVHGMGAGGYIAETYFINMIVYGHYTMTIMLDGYLIYSRANVIIDKDEVVVGRLGDESLPLILVPGIADNVYVIYSTIDGAIPGATITLINNTNPFFAYNAPDEVIPGDTITSRFENVRYGVYTLRISLMGYVTYVNNSFVIAAPNVSYNGGDPVMLDK